MLKKVLQYSRSGKFIKEYSSISEAKRAMTGSNDQNSYINRVVDTDRTAYDCYWKLKIQNSIPKKIEISEKKIYRMPVYAFDLEGNYIAAYNDAREAAEKHGCKTGMITRSARKVLRTVNGHIFRFANEFERKPKKIKVDLTVPRPRKSVRAKNVLTGEAHTFDSITEAAEKLKLNRCSISHVLRGRGTLVGKQWAFKVISQ